LASQGVKIEVDNAFSWNLDWQFFDSSPAERNFGGFGLKRFLHWISIPSAAASLKVPQVLASAVDRICLLRAA